VALPAFARIEELEHRVRLLERWLELYVALFSRIAILRRFQWGPEARFEILALKNAERLSAAEAARRASVSTSTIHRWTGEGRAHPERLTIGSLLKAVPPIRRISDAVRRKVQEMATPGSHWRPRSSPRNPPRRKSGFSFRRPSLATVQRGS